MSDIMSIMSGICVCRLSLTYVDYFRWIQTLYDRWMLIPPGRSRYRQVSILTSRCRCISIYLTLDVDCPGEVDGGCQLETNWRGTDVSSRSNRLRRQVNSTRHSSDRSRCFSFPASHSSPRHLTRRIINRACAHLQSIPIVTSTGRSGWGHGRK